MSICIYYSILPTALKADVTDLPELEDVIKKKLNAVKDEYTRQTSCAALFLLKKALAKEGLKNGLTLLYYNGEGQPLLKNGWQISISHSAQLIAVAISRSELLGIDVEQIKDRRIDSIARLFCEEDQAYIKQSDNALLAFYNIWTAKEALLKITQVDIERVLKCSVGTQTATLNNVIYKLQHPELDINYSMCLASINECIPTLAQVRL